MTTLFDDRIVEYIRTSEFYVDKYPLGIDIIKYFAKYKGSSTGAQMICDHKFSVAESRVVNRFLGQYKPIIYEITVRTHVSKVYCIMHVDDFHRVISAMSDYHFAFYNNMSIYLKSVGTEDIMSYKRKPVKNEEEYFVEIDKLLNDRPQIDEQFISDGKKFLDHFSKSLIVYHNLNKEMASRLQMYYNEFKKDKYDIYNQKKYKVYFISENKYNTPLLVWLTQFLPFDKSEFATFVKAKLLNGEYITAYYLVPVNDNDDMLRSIEHIDVKFEDDDDEIVDMSAVEETMFVNDRLKSIGSRYAFEFIKLINGHMVGYFKPAGSGRPMLLQRAVDLMIESSKQPKSIID